MNEPGTAARAGRSLTESAQRAETQLRRPSLKLSFGLEKTVVNSSEPSLQRIRANLEGSFWVVHNSFAEQDFLTSCGNPRLFRPLV
jgi:hypothetical protein